MGQAKLRGTKEARTEVAIRLQLDREEAAARARKAKWDAMDAAEKARELESAKAMAELMGLGFPADLAHVVSRIGR